MRWDQPHRERAGNVTSPSAVGRLRLQAGRWRLRRRGTTAGASPRPSVSGRIGEARRTKLRAAREKRTFFPPRFTTATLLPVTRPRRRKSLYAKELDVILAHDSRNGLVKLVSASGRGSPSPRVNPNSRRPAAAGCGRGGISSRLRRRRTARWRCACRRCPRGRRSCRGRTPDA